MSRRGQKTTAEDESVYAWAGLMPPGKAAAPITKTYNVATSARSPRDQEKPKMHADSSQMQHFLNPVHGVRDAQVRAGLTPTNHHRNNVLAMKEQSRMNALRKQQEAQADATPAWKRTPSGRGPRPPSAGMRRASGSPDSANGGRNFLEENMVTAGLPSKPPPQPKASPQMDAAAFLQKRDYGKVPQYLVERKMELAERYEAEAAAKEAALIPAGMRVLPEAERQEMLATLEKNKQEVEKAIQRLPFVIETPSQIRWQNELLKRQKEIEDAFKIFRRPKVLVQAC